MRGAELSALDGVLSRYPYAQALRVLTTKASIQLNMPDAKKRLARTALATIDRKWLKRILSRAEGSLSHLWKERPKTVERTTLPFTGMPKSSLEDDNPPSGYFSESQTEGKEEPARQKAQAHEKLMEDTYQALEEAKRSMEYYESLAYKREEIESDIKHTHDIMTANDTASTSSVSLPDSPPSRPAVAASDEASSPKEKRDLAAPSRTVSEGALSETLAGLLAKQGKVDRAIEMYAQLSRLYPEKKQFFLLKIQELSS